MRWLAGIVITVLLAGVFFYNWPSSTSNNLKEEVPRLVGDKTKIEAGKFIIVKNIAELNPLPDSDFAVLLWFNMKNKLGNGSKASIAAKYEQQLENKPGWAIRISNHKKIFRPEVYWRNAAGNGRWYSFAEFPFRQNRWFGLSLSYKQGKYLGLKAYQVEKGKKTESLNLGGYFLPGVFPTSAADLKVGSIGGDFFLGTIGKIYAGAGLLDKDWQNKIAEQCLKTENLETFCLVK